MEKPTTVGHRYSDDHLLDVAAAVAKGWAGVPPVWLLDVDGVINASKPGWGGPPVSRRIWANGKHLVVRREPALIARIRELINARAVEVRWCSTWCPWADQLERL
jgi:hypothetical protein